MERVSYRTGFVERRTEARLPAITLEATDLSEDVLTHLDRLLDLAGTYGDPNAGDSIQPIMAYQPAGLPSVTTERSLPRRFRVKLRTSP